MPKDFYTYVKKKDGEINIKHIAKRFPHLSKEEFLSGMGRWLEHKGMKGNKKREAIKAMEIWWFNEIEIYRKVRKPFQPKIKFPIGEFKPE